MRLTLGTIAGIVALSLTVPGVPKAVEAPDPPTAAAELLTLTNITRTTTGLPALLKDERLNTVARARSEDMIHRNYFSHQIPPEGYTVLDLLESLGINFRSAAENIEWNNAAKHVSVPYANADFANSPGHRDNVVDPRYNRIGVGVAEGFGKSMYTIVFLEEVPRQTMTTDASSSSLAEEEARLPLENTPTFQTQQKFPGAPALQPPGTMTSPTNPALSDRPARALRTRSTLFEVVINHILRLFLNL